MKKELRDALCKLSEFYFFGRCNVQRTDDSGMGCPSDRCPTGTAARRDGVRESQRENDRVVQMYAVDSLSTRGIMHSELPTEFMK